MSELATTRRVKRGWMNLKVHDIIEETHDTKTFFFQDAEEGGRPYDFVAGQYLTFRYDTVAEKPVVRSYTMSGSPCQTDASIVTVKRIPGGLISNWMCDNLKVGDICRARGPIGRFCYEPEKDAPNLVMVAAGSGVTPFTSMIREYAPHLGKSGFPKSLHLLVAFRSKSDLINWRDLSAAKVFPHVNIVVALTREHAEDEGFWYGRPDDAMLETFLGERYLDSTFMSCGPQAIMDLMTNHLKQVAVAPERIKTESFDS